MNARPLHSAWILLFGFRPLRVRDAEASAKAAERLDRVSHFTGVMILESAVALLLAVGVFAGLTGLVGLATVCAGVAIGTWLTRLGYLTWAIWALAQPEIAS